MLAGAIWATPALANGEGEITVAPVSYADLDLSTERGLSVFHSRYRRAAQYVCGMDIRDTGTRLPSPESRTCYAEKLRDFDRRLAAIIEAERRNV
jgi:UrcA family protein